MQDTTHSLKPVGTLMRPIPRVWPSSSVSAAATEIRDSGLPAVAVTEHYLYVATVTQESLARAIASGVQPDDPIERAFDKNVVCLPPYAMRDQALDQFTKNGVTAIPIVDDYGRLLGVVTPADLYPKPNRPPRPPAVGGMATPFGVYLTTGYISAGAGSLALMITGAVIALLHIGGQTSAELLQRLSLQLNLHIAPGVFEGLGFVLFLLGFRLIPLSKIHAAEHKVVHAIERGEELTRENVRRMPRVHPRCGTNLAVGAILLTSIIFGGIQLGQDKDGRMLLDPSVIVIVALITTFFLWRPLGALAQTWFTTSEPSDKHIDMGIRSGQELLKRYATGPGGRQSFLARLWNTGLFHVMAGSTIVLGLLYAIQEVFKIPIPGMN